MLRSHGVKRMKSFLLVIFLFFVSSSNAATKHDIGIKKFKFSPAEITISVGDTIRWTNKEKRQYHSIWFEQLGEPEPDYFFPGEFFERTFNDIGNFPYRCGPHPKMKGIVHVLKTTENVQNAKAIITYSVESVEDGDTIVIKYKGKTQRVQLIGIDAPEDTQNPKLNLDSRNKKIEKNDLLKMGKASTEYLQTLIKAGEKVSLEGNLSQKDKYNRLPAIVINQKGQSLNQEMVKTGYALLLTRFPLDEDFKASLKEAQNFARSEKLGLWKKHPQLMEKWSN